MALVPGVPDENVHWDVRDALPSVTTRRGRMLAWQASLPVPRQLLSKLGELAMHSHARDIALPRPCVFRGRATTGCMLVLVWVGSTMSTEVMVGAPACLLVMPGVWPHVVRLWRHASDLFGDRPDGPTDGRCLCTDGGSLFSGTAWSCAS